ncbi:MAG: DUF2079 domain-containing protein [Chloroflexi bacterium]|nr:DUF2079 domain-containing protein [Chloroflexota bacterium]
MYRRIPAAVVWSLVLLYIGVFGWLSVTRHQAFATNAYDLGNANQAIWNTVHGRPLYFTNWRGVELNLATDSRLAMHVEPIYFLLAPIYWLWQRPETLLILQTVVLALGAWPVFWLARQRLGDLAGVAFAAVYLLFPGLEAANLWEFHAVALAAPLLLFAFYFGQARRWLLFWLCALLAMATKEEIPLSVALMGFYFAFWGIRQARSRGFSRVFEPNSDRLKARLQTQTAVRNGGLSRIPSETRHGLAVALVGVVWFVVAFFFVIPYFEGSGSPYLKYYEGLATGPSGLTARFQAVFTTLFSQRNLQYLVDLFTPVGFLSVFSPLTLAFSAPDLAINLLSTHEPMHFVEKYHYVAPLLPGIMISAILGVSWLARRLAERLHVPFRAGVLLLTAGMLGATGYYHTYHGYTPLARAFERYTVTAHHRLGEAIAQEIPADAAVSAQPNLNPHVSGRKTLYRFPYIGDADYVFLDVSTLADKDDQYGLIQALLDGDRFGLVRAEDGYLLLRRGAPAQPTLPEAFYGFARLPAEPDDAEAPPVSQYTTDIVFEDALRLVGFDLADGRRTEMPQTPLRFTLYWQVTQPLAADYRIALYLLDDQRQVIGGMNLDQQPATQFWYPLSRWQPGETIKMEINDMPWWTSQYPRYGVAVGVLKGADPWERGIRLQPDAGIGSVMTPLADNETLVELMRFRTDAGGMSERIALPPRFQPPQRMIAQEALWEGGMKLIGYRLPSATIHGGGPVNVVLYWETQQPIATNYKVFVHLVRDGQLVGQHDAEPGLDGFPTSNWRVGEVIPDRHPIQIPSDAPSGAYHLLVGFYDPVSGERVILSDGGDSVTLSNAVEVSE